MASAMSIAQKRKQSIVRKTPRTGGKGLPSRTGGKKLPGTRIKKGHRYAPGTLALKEIRKCQKESLLYIKKTLFARLIKELVMDQAHTPLQPKKNKATKALKAKATPKCKPLPTKQPRRIVEDDSDEDMPDATQNPTVENNNSEDTTAQQATLDNKQDDNEQDEDKQEQDKQDQDVRDQDVQGRDFQASYN
ncbi:uncharacterized protein SEPMUDRAFT_112266 [Sphaerulina musiva SO2202]|uniref:Uncharacterized protein n=1 Tax=Sphaerulina musiva (strain SO2202) TaxID=692275 RepID=N1QGC7_SPHMS|nr:uncharacterized protein SEPMUDRAFT_112266 [Sphaerulina musiva SO2202]EMF16200.1 hypothetical protein SEPMUDRAFT_112266 [Sphaerulina musiva SO2202]